MLSVSSAETVLPSGMTRPATVSALPSVTSAASSALPSDSNRLRNASVFATKSVSQLSSTRTAVFESGDEAVGRNPAGFLGSAREAFFTKHGDCPLHVALGLGKSLLAVHHACAGAFAQVLDELGVDVHSVGLVSKSVGAKEFASNVGALKVCSPAAPTTSPSVPGEPNGTEPSPFSAIEPRASLSASPSRTESAIAPQNRRIARIASSFPGTQ